jgi:2-oxoglutarate ferredoxin oxidoreductase subunit delta
VDVCPKKCLALVKGGFNAKGYHPAAQISSDCIGCAMCAQMCPDVAITVEKD